MEKSANSPYIKKLRQRNQTINYKQSRINKTTKNNNETTTTNSLITEQTVTSTETCTNYKDFDDDDVSDDENDDDDVSDDENDDDDDVSDDVKDDDDVSDDVKDVFHSMVQTMNNLALEANPDDKEMHTIFKTQRGKYNK